MGGWVGGWVGGWAGELMGRGCRGARLHPAAAFNTPRLGGLPGRITSAGTCPTHLQQQPYVELHHEHRRVQAQHLGLAQQPQAAVGVGAGAGVHPARV